jgi:hypothetical protein
MGTATIPSIGEFSQQGERRRGSNSARVGAAVSPILAPARYVRISLFEVLTGYSTKAIEGKIANGVWVEGREYKRAPDGHVLVDMKGYERWVEGQRQVASANREAKSS